MQDDLLVLFFVQGERVAHFATLLDENLVDLQLDCLTLDDLLLHTILRD